MTNEYARTFGQSIIGLAVFDRSALHAEAIGHCDRRAACRRGWQTSSVLSGRSVDAFSWHRDVVVVFTGSAGPTARPFGGQMDGSGRPSPTNSLSAVLHGHGIRSYAARRDR